MNERGEKMIFNIEEFDTDLTLFRLKYSTCLITAIISVSTITAATKMQKSL